MVAIYFLSGLCFGILLSTHGDIIVGWFSFLSQKKIPLSELRMKNPPPPPPKNNLVSGDITYTANEHVYRTEYPQNKNECCVLRVENGKQFLFTPSGEKLPHQVSSHFYQNAVDANLGVGIAIISLHCVSADSEKPATVSGAEVLEKLETISSPRPRGD